MESELLKRDVRRRKRALSVGGRITPGSVARPRLSYHQSNRYIRAQLIDDNAGKTLCSISSETKAFRAATLVKTSLKSIGTAQEVGKQLAAKAKAQGIEQAVLDRGHRAYSGALKALVEAARETGLKI